MAQNTENRSLEEHLFTDLYKYEKKSAKAAEQRRAEFLENQKCRRHQDVDKGRDLTNLLEEGLSFETEEFMICENIPESVDESEKSFKFELMNSEWMVKIPSDLEDNWLIKMCPDGARMLLVAKRHETIMYYEKTMRKLKFETSLPGGGKYHKNGLTVLDCVYNKVMKTIFVLDCLYWNCMSLLDAEAEFRFYWLKTKFEENDKLVQVSKHHQLSLLPFFSYRTDTLQETMLNVIDIKGQQVPYEGVVFYHKISHYHFGYSPLVLFLTSFMLPEMFNINVDSLNLRRKPKDYECIAQYLQELCTKSKRKKKSADSEEGNAEMEVM